MNKQQILIFALGGPGSGKGSICQRLTRIYQPIITTISVGELLRRSVDKSVQRILNQGGVVPPDYSSQVLHAHLPTLNSDILIVDGFPRDVAAARIWDDQYSDTKSNALFFDVDDTILRRRLIARGRSDDTTSVIERRLEFHRANTPPLWEYMHAQGRATKIDAAGSIDDVVKLAELALLDSPFNIQNHLMDSHR